MLQDVDSRPGGASDGVVRLTVGKRRSSVSVGFIDGGPQLVLRERGKAITRPFGPSPRRHDLDQIHPLVDELSYPAPDLIGPLSLVVDAEVEVA